MAKVNIKSEITTPFRGFYCAGKAFCGLKTDKRRLIKNKRLQAGHKKIK